MHPTATRESVHSIMTRQTAVQGFATTHVQRDLLAVHQDNHSTHAHGPNSSGSLRPVNSPFRKETTDTLQTFKRTDRQCIRKDHLPPQPAVFQPSEVPPRVVPQAPTQAASSRPPPHEMGANTIRPWTSGTRIGLKGLTNTGGSGWESDRASPCSLSPNTTDKYIELHVA